MIYLDAGTTYSKIITSEKNFDEVFLVDKKDVYNWLRAQEADGIALTASTLACLFYLNEEK